MLRRVEGWVVDRFYGGRVVKDVVMACLRADLLEDLMGFLEARASAFNRSLEGLGAGEHSLAGSAIHQEYVRLIEARLARPLEKHGKSVEQFFGICKTIQDAGHAEDIAPFLHVILAASDYVLFADVMRDPDKRAYFFHILRGLQRQFRAKLEAAEKGAGGGTENGAAADGGGDGGGGGSKSSGEGEGKRK
jgi:hypothetical protein